MITVPELIFSNGAGRDSVAVVVMQAKQLTPHYTHVFCNVGEKSENPKTLEYLENHLKPYCERNGINFIEIQKRDAEGNAVDLWDYTLNPNTKSIPIPYYMTGSAPANRGCTVDFKVRVLNNWIKKQGYKHVRLGIGFNADESKRARKKPLFPIDRETHYDEKTHDWKTGRKLGFEMIYEFPLIDANINRANVEQVILKAGLPLPPESCCVYCPFMNRNARIEQKKHDPESYNRAVYFEKEANAKKKRAKPNAKELFLHPDKFPLSETPDQPSLWDLWNDEDNQCQIGHCGV